MKNGWESLCVGDIITIKKGNKYKCVYVIDAPPHPITKSETIEVIEFFDTNLKVYDVDHNSYINVDSPYQNNFNYRYPDGSLVEVKWGSHKKMAGTIIEMIQPKYSPYPSNGRTKVHTFFVPVYRVMMIDNTIEEIPHGKLKLVAKP